MTYTVTYTQSASYFEHYDTYFGPLPAGQIQVGVDQFGGRLVPRSTFDGNASFFVETLRCILEIGSQQVIFVATDVSSFASYEKNALTPGWRANAGPVLHTVPTTPWSFDPADWDTMLANQELMTETIMPALEAITPGAGTYMNEADFRQPDFQRAFFGSKYERLLAVKKIYDPDMFFYVTKGVGSEVWTVAEDGHMCKAGGSFSHETS